MQNDPVNFVDPSGLDTCYTDIDGKTVCIPDITAGVIINISGGAQSIGVGGVSQGPMVIEAPPVDGPTGGDFPQDTNTARNLENDPCDSSIHGAAIQSDLSQIATYRRQTGCELEYTAIQAQTFNC